MYQTKKITYKGPAAELLKAKDEEIEGLEYTIDNLEDLVEDLEVHEEELKERIVLLEEDYQKQLLEWSALKIENAKLKADMKFEKTISFLAVVVLSIANLAIHYFIR